MNYDGIIMGLIIALSFYSGWAFGIYIYKANMMEVKKKILDELREENEKHRVI